VCRVVYSSLLLKCFLSHGRKYSKVHDNLVYWSAYKIEKYIKKLISTRNFRQFVHNMFADTLLFSYYGLTQTVLESSVPTEPCFHGESRMSGSSHCPKRHEHFQEITLKND
jgi:hypothetical protein